MGWSWLARFVSAWRRVSAMRMVRPASMIAGLATAFVVLGSSAPSTVARRFSPRQPPLTRYSSVHGCYALRSPAGGNPIAAADGPFRMQAAPT